MRPLCSTVVAKDKARCFALELEKPGAKALSPAPTGLSPADVKDAYNLPAGGGAGRTVGIVVAYDAPTAEADLVHYRQQFGLPPLRAGQFTKIDQRGGTDYPAPDPGWAGEAALDVDAVTAVAPDANIVLVVADDNSFENLGAGVNAAVAAGAEVVNNSYGTGYDASPGSGEDNTLLPVNEQYYNHPGVAIVASSGDSDYGVSFPASSNYVTSIGGTSLVKDPATARGWTESVWSNNYGGAGSGCSVVFDKPEFQQDTGCGKRAVSDVSAVADPATGLSVYYTFDGGQWSQYGGTSLSAPLISGIYALAGKPAPNTYPNAYPYAKTDALFDVTQGNNGTCNPSYLCTAGAGYDGPTGLGTPDGFSAFGIGPHGTVAGTVTDTAGKPVAGALVSLGDGGSARTGADGRYTLEAPPGSYTATVSAYGYRTVTKKNIVVTDGGAVTADFTLTAATFRTISGRVADGSGHGYALYSRIDVAGMPGGPVYTDPYTGNYALNLPQGGSFDATFTAIIPGYLPQTKTIKVGAADRSLNVSLKIDPAAENPTGYTYTTTGKTETFDAATAPAGWSVTNNADQPGWVFTDEGKRGNLTGGAGGFAIVDSDKSGSGKTQDTYLNSPAYDLSKASNPTLEFDTAFRQYRSSNGVVQLSTDNGASWSTVWDASSTTTTGHVRVALPAQAKVAGAKVRFHYTGSFAYYWEVDNVFVGNRKLTPVSGGLLEGVVTDNNTGAFVKGAKVTHADDPSITATSGPTGDPAVGDGFYWLFTPKTGKQPFVASKAGYASDTRTPTAPANLTTRQDFVLKAGRITVTPESINATVKMGASATATLNLKNTGTEPVKVTLSESGGGFVMQSKTGAPLQKVKASTVKGSMKAAAAKNAAKNAAGAKRAATAAPFAAAGPSADAWEPVADYPSTIQDSAAATINGKVYSVGGYNGSDDTNNLYVYDPQAASWTELAAAGDAREGGAAAAMGGKLVYTGGWGPGGTPDGKTEVYDPASDSWTVAAQNPKPYAGAGHAVVGGKLYVVGGCTASACGKADVQVYDAGSDSWSSVAAYPKDVAWQSCGGLGGKLYCAGGTTDGGSMSSAYSYDPAADSWSEIADLPTDLWGSFYATANGQLLVSGGAANSSTEITNIGYAFDPASGEWSPLPNLNTALYRGAGALGFYAIGGNPGGSSAPPVATTQLLAGYDQGGDGTDVPWLSIDPTELTLPAGGSATATVTMNAADPSVAQPGSYTAGIAFATDSPYPVPTVPVTMTVTPPNTWGKVAGTVTSAADGKPIAGATVELDGWAQQYTLITDKDGKYGIWLDRRNNPLTAIAAKDGFKPQTATIKVVAKQTVTKNWSLVKAR